MKVVVFGLTKAWTSLLTNEIANMVNADGEIRGATFISELYKKET